MTLQKHVNNSGFPLQLAIANLVISTHNWNVLYEEHNWVQDNNNGFIDLVIEDQYKTWLMNIECKRVRDSKWIFLRDTNATPTRRHAKLWVSSRRDGESLNHFGWADVPMDPDTAQSSYCVVPGQDSKARPMLERIASNVVISTEARALQETKTLSSHYSTLPISSVGLGLDFAQYACHNIRHHHLAAGPCPAHNKPVELTACSPPV